MQKLSELSDRAGPPTLLIVEDELLVRVALSDYLQVCGFRVLTAMNTSEAIETLNSGARIDLVFSDVVMPGPINGLGLAQWLRSNRPELPIVLTSGDSSKIKAAKELCENEPFVSKPYRFEAVASQIRSLIRCSRTKLGSVVAAK